MKKIIIYIALVLFAINISTAEDTPYNFLRFNSSARGAAMANAVSSIENDISFIFFNPALISTVEEKKFSATFSKHVLDINSGNAVYLIDGLFESGTFAGMVNFHSYGSFDEATNLGQQTGRTFTANDISLGATYSNELDSNWYYGVTAKVVFSTLESQSASAFGIDAGMFYRINDRSNLGLSILHAGPELSSFPNYSGSLPTDVRFGINHRLKGLPLLVNFSLHHLADESEDLFSKFKNFSIGGELYISDNIRLRAGYDNQIRGFASSDENKGLAGLSGGLGLNFEDFNFDYAYAEYGASQGIHRFSLALDF